MATIQSISIKGTQDRMCPKPHTVYEIRIRVTIRSWSIWRRYSEFVDLNDELTKSTGTSPPSPLPPKHVWTLRSSLRNARIIEERKKGLETYLRAIIAPNDLQWRNHYAFCQFLCIPMAKTAPPAGAASSLNKNAGETNARRLTTATRVEEHTDWQTYSAYLSLERQLADVAERIGVLTKGVEALCNAGMSQEEKQRRMDMVARLRDDSGGQNVSSGPSSNQTPSEWWEWKFSDCARYVTRIFGAQS